MAAAKPPRLLSIDGRGWGESGEEGGWRIWDMIEEKVYDAPSAEGRGERKKKSGEDI